VPVTFAASSEDQRRIEDFLAEFDDQVATLLRQCRALLQERFPTAHELVYDNYNFLVFGFCASRRPSTGVVSLTGAANGAGLALLHGARLPDPHALLQGSGKQTRFLRLPDVATLLEPRVATLLDLATTSGPQPMPDAGGGVTVVVSVSPNRRPRRRDR
jgi:hypothetical protein